MGTLCVTLIGVFLSAQCSDVMGEGFFYEKPKENISILDYKMNLKTGYKLKNKCEMKVKNNKEKDLSSINLVLDNIFNIKDIKVNGKKMKFSHELNTLTINLENPLKKGEEAMLEIAYKGKVNIFDYMDYQKIVVNKSNIVLPGKGFAWYPKNFENNKINFEVNLDSDIEVESNLQLNKEKLQGTTKEVFFIGGNVQSKNIEGYNIIYPIDYSEEIMQFTLENLEERLKEDGFKKEDYEAIKKEKTIIMSPMPIEIGKGAEVIDGNLFILAG